MHFCHQSLPTPVRAWSLETPFYALVCALALERTMHALTSGRGHRLAFALAALCTLIRPDGAIALATIGIAILWVSLRNRGVSAGSIRGLIGRFLPGAILLLIGIGAHWLYYGAPFPNTVSAKASGYTIELLRNARDYLFQMILAQPTGIPIYALA